MSKFDDQHPRANDGKFTNKDHDWPPGGMDALGGPTCPRHGGQWGDDATCEHCTDANGDVRLVDQPGPLGPGALGGMEALGGPICPRHGGQWGDDATCEHCTDANGDVRPVDQPGPLGPGAVSAWEDKANQATKAAWVRSTQKSGAVTEEERAAATTVMRDAMNGWYVCNTQAANYLAEETLNHPDDDKKALEVATKRYSEDEARNNPTWPDEYDVDEAMDCAREALDTTTNGSEGAIWETFGGGTKEEDALIQRVLPTGDRQEAAQMIVEAFKKLREM